MSEYISKAKTTVIKFNSRASVKIKDSFYTFEYGEERQIDDYENTDIDKEIQALTDDCNNVVDKQIQEVVDMILHQKN
jgi:hypothetical protein